MKRWHRRAFQGDRQFNAERPGSDDGDVCFGQNGVLSPPVQCAPEGTGSLASLPASLPNGSGVWLLKENPERASLRVLVEEISGR